MDEEIPRYVRICMFPQLLKIEAYVSPIVAPSAKTDESLGNVFDCSHAYNLKHSEIDYIALNSAWAVNVIDAQTALQAGTTSYKADLPHPGYIVSCSPRHIIYIF